MPERSLIEIINNLLPAIAGVLMSVFISIVRVIYDKEETKVLRILLESFLCGALTLTINSGIVALGFGNNWPVFIGGVVGYFGSVRVREFAIKLAHRRIK